MKYLEDRTDCILASIKEGDSFSIDSAQFILVSHDTTNDDLSLCKIKGSSSYVYIARSSRVTERKQVVKSILPIHSPLFLEQNFKGHVLYIMDEKYRYHIYVYHELDMVDRENFQSLVKAKTMDYPNKSSKFYYYSDLDKMSKDFSLRSDKISLGISNLWYQINTYKRCNNLILLISVFIVIIAICLFLAYIGIPANSLNFGSTSLSLIFLSISLCLICVLTNYFANKFKEK